MFALNSAVHSYLILAYAEGDKVAMNVGFYYMANAGGRLAGTVLSGALYQWQGLERACWPRPRSSSPRGCCRGVAGRGPARRAARARGVAAALRDGHLGVGERVAIVRGGMPARQLARQPRELVGPRARLQGVERAARLA